MGKETDQPYRFVAIGECMVEMAPLAQADTFQMRFAGDTFNTCWYAKQLAPDMSVSFCSRVGRDQTSDQMLAMMAGAGVETDHVQRCDTRTVGLYLISLQDGERSFSYWRGQSAARALGTDRAALERAVAGADMIYLSGITLGILDAAGRDTVLAVLAGARAAGAKIAFDSNLRPRLWPSVGAMCDAVMQAAAISDSVLPSYDDEADFFGDATPEATLQRYRAAGAKTVIVKNGPGQVAYWDEGASGAVAVAPAAEIVDTTSAGDSFNAGVFAGLAMGKGLEESILQGAKTARHVIGQRGALVVLPR